MLHRLLTTLDINQKLRKYYNRLVHDTPIFITFITRFRISISIISLYKEICELRKLDKESQNIT